VLEQLGGAAEHVEQTTADDWGARAAAPLHLVALEVRGGGRLLGRAAGLADDVYDSAGAPSGRELRAVALAALVPVPGGLMWDVGSGSGAVAIEWMRAAPGARAVALDRDARCADVIAANALALGVPGLRVVIGEAPDALDELDERPDAIFVGGGLTTYGLLTRCRKALAPGGRLVACARTVEAETLLSRGYAEQGGRLTRLQVARAQPVGDRTGWLPAAPVMLWELSVPWR
jgi:precorrin-6Y C5,15-methyltransferase (decarboxylating)